MHRKPMLFVAGWIATVLVTGVTAQANLIGNGSFETPAITSNFAQFAGSTALAPWVITGQGIDHDVAFQAADGLRIISTRWLDPSSIYQDVTTASAQSYVLSFQATRERPEGVVAQASTRGIDVFWNSTNLGPIFFPPDLTQTNANMHWRSFTFTVVGTGLDRVRFSDINSGVAGYGVALDDVRLEILPEPTSLGLMGAMSVMLRRRR